MQIISLAFYGCVIDDKPTVALAMEHQVVKVDKTSDVESDADQCGLGFIDSCVHLTNISQRVIDVSLCAM